MPCLESICTRASTARIYRVHLYSCDTVCVSTTNAIGNDEFVEQREAFSTRMHPLTLFFFARLSRFLPPLLSNLLSRHYFFPPLRLSSIRSWLLAFQPLRNVSLLNVPQNHSRIFSFFSPFFLTSLVIHASHCARFYYDDTSQQCDTAAKIELFYDSKVLCLTSTCRMLASFNAMSFFFLPNPSSLFQIHPLFKNYVFFCSFDIEVTRILRERRVHFFFCQRFRKRRYKK